MTQNGRTPPIYLVVVVLVGLASIVGVGMMNSPLKDEVDISDVIFEGAVALLALVWIAIVQRSIDDRRVYVPLVLGFSFIFWAYFKDFADEFVRFPARYDLIENFGAVLGMASAGIGFARWFGTLHKANVRLGAEVGARTADLEASNRTLAVTLKEKSALVHELHHRVKNNLQVVESLLRLQRRTLQGLDAREIIGEAYNRIRSIGAVHELLYQDTTSSDSISVREYFGTLIRNLEETYGTADRGISISLHSDSMMLDIDRAVLCGLLLNELVTNAIKHAFPASAHGAIMVAFHKSPETLEVSITDNGIGLPGEVSPESSPSTASSQSLGYKLVRTWIRQLRAEMRIDRDNGTAVSFTFATAQPSPAKSLARN